MTRSEAFRAIVTATRDHVHQGRIGKRVIHEKADDGKVRIVTKPRSLDEWTQKHGRRTA